jgi:hypothetical protein
MVKKSLQRRHAQTVKNGASSYKTNYNNILSQTLIHCLGSTVTAILLNEWILPTGGVASGRVCPAVDLF